MAKETPLKHKVIISGTGRAGTTFLVRLLSELGLDTGINVANWERKYFEHCNAGLEHDILDCETPYIIKNPALCETLAAALDTGRFVIDHAYVPIRELAAVTASRADVGGANGSRPGGPWGTADPATQGAVMAELFHGLVYTLVANDVPITFIEFPRMVTDPDYTYGKLEFLVKAIGRETFGRAFARVADPSLVHAFGPGARKVDRKEPESRRRPRGLKALLRSWR